MSLSFIEKLKERVAAFDDVLGFHADTNFLKKDLMQGLILGMNYAIEALEREAAGTGEGQSEPLTVTVTPEEKSALMSCLTAARKPSKQVADLIDGLVEQRQEAVHPIPQAEPEIDEGGKAEISPQTEIPSVSAQGVASLTQKTRVLNAWNAGWRTATDLAREADVPLRNISTMLSLLRSSGYIEKNCPITNASRKERVLKAWEGGVRQHRELLTSAKVTSIQLNACLRELREEGKIPSEEGLESYGTESNRIDEDVAEQRQQCDFPEKTRDDAAPTEKEMADALIALGARVKPVVFNKQTLYSLDGILTPANRIIEAAGEEKNRRVAAPDQGKLQAD